MSDRDRERDRRKGPPPSAVLDRLQKLRYAAQAQNKWDAYAWSDVVEDLKSLTMSADTRAAFEEVLAVMPSAASVWCRYAAGELSSSGSLDNAKLLFGRCLLVCPCVELHQHYLTFVKRSGEGRGPAGQAELRQAYEFSLDLVGQDMDAGGLWREYIEFLKSPKPGTEQFNTLFPGALEGQEEAARTPVVRRAYQRAVGVPSVQLESLWRDYEGWENKVDKQLARKVLDELRPRFQAARGTLRERRRKLEAINTSMLPFPPGMGAAPQVGQVVAWQAYVAYERSNPQRLETDSPVLHARISLAFSQALNYMWSFPELWHEYVAWASEAGGLEKAVPVLARAQAALPGCALFHFLHADMLETQGDAEGARQVYDVLAQQLEAELPQPSTPGAADPTPSPYGGEQGALIWVQYMRFLRRTADPGLARQLFLRARKWQQGSPATAGTGPAGAQGGGRGTGWQVYAGAAAMEWQADRASPAVACRVFELGLEDPKLAKDPDYIIAYHKFLVEAGDSDNARALFERGLAEPEVARCAEVWRTYAAFEYTCGDLAAASQVEQRMRAALAGSTGAEKGAQPQLHLALLKYAFEGALPCAPAQRRHLQRAAGMAVALTQDEETQIGERYLAERGPPADRERFGSEPRDVAPGRDRDRDRDFRGPPPPHGREEGPPPRPMLDPLEQLAMDLPPPHALEGPPVPVEAVMDVVMFWQPTPEAVAFVCAELDAGRMPPSNNGVEVPQLFEVPPWGGRPYDGYDEPPGGGYPPPHMGPPRGPPHDPYGPPPPDPYYDGPPPPDPYYDGPPGPGPMPRKRRWDADRDREGPYGPPPGDYGPPPGDYGPPPPHWRDDRGPPRGPPR